ncbi:hypothetical protein BV911_14755 [Pseudoruegeria sp. SK021]|nr:hypothetical protein BV911_14755 [Pseudoruegeria sp. SK021]
MGWLELTHKLNMVWPATMKIKTTRGESRPVAFPKTRANDAGGRSLARKRKFAEVESTSYPGIVNDEKLGVSMQPIESDT